MPGNPVRALLATDHRVLVDGLRAVLAPFAGRVAIVPESSSYSSPEVILRSVERACPDVVVLEVSRARVSLVGRLLAERPDLRVLALGRAGEESLPEALRAGAQAYARTSLRGEQLADAIEAVATGMPMLDGGFNRQPLE